MTKQEAYELAPLIKDNHGWYIVDGWRLRKIYSYNELQGGRKEWYFPATIRELDDLNPQVYGMQITCTGHGTIHIDKTLALEAIERGW